MLKLILGRAKTGKTAAVMEEIRKGLTGGGQSVLLVPEQYSHEAERELLSVCGDRMCLGAEVLSFTRLAARVARPAPLRAGRGAPRGARLRHAVRRALARRPRPRPPPARRAPRRRDRGGDRRVGRPLRARPGLAAAAAFRCRGREDVVHFPP